MPRFVVLRHELPEGHPRGLHWDLMLESGATLRTWALESEPSDGGVIDAEQLADHRLDYLAYEGPISGDRGSVTRWDAGEYTLVGESDEALVVQLNGVRLAGRVTLSRSPGGDHSWRVSFGAAPISG